MRRFFRGILKCNAGSKSPWRTPDHPPYSQMVEVALRALSEEGGSTESSISSYIESTFTDLPWGHDRLLPYYLGKLVVSGEISSPSHGRYQLSLHHHLLSSGHSLVHRRGRACLYRPNPSSFPSFKPIPSASPRRRGRSAAPRFRGSRSESFAECKSLVHLEEGSDPPRRRRGRPPLRGGGVGGEAMRRSVTRSRRSRGSRIRSDGVRGGKLLKSGDCGDNSECFELIHAQSSPEKLQSLLSPGQNFSSPELTDPERPMQEDDGGGQLASPQPEHGEGQAFTVSLLSEHGERQFSAAREVPLLTLEPAEVSYCPSPVHSEHSEWKSSQGEAVASTVLEQTEPSEEKTSPVEQPSVLSLEKSENYGHGPEMPSGHSHEIPKNDGHDPEMPENDDHGFEKPENDGHGPEKPENHGHGPEISETEGYGTEKPDGHSPEKHENDGHGLEKHENKHENDGHGLEKLENVVHGPAMLENDDHGLEKPEEDHDKCSPGKRTAMVALDQEELVPLLLPDSDEGGSSGASTKKKKSHGKRRRLKLWFEG